MSADRNNLERERSTTPNAGGTSRDTTDTSNRSGSKSLSNDAGKRQERSDNERAIQMGHEGRSSTGVSRRQQSPVYGPGSGQLSPFSLMRRMAEDMDRMFEDFGFGRSGLGLLPGFGAGLNRGAWGGGSAIDQMAAWSPQVETFRRGDRLVVRADLPGLKKDDVKVEIEDGVLAISGERREEHEEDRDDYYRSERTYGQFYRAIPLPEGAREDQCEASFKDGVLEVSLLAPKEEKRSARQIQVK